MVNKRSTPLDDQGQTNKTGVWVDSYIHRFCFFAQLSKTKCCDADQKRKRATQKV